MRIKNLFYSLIICLIINVIPAKSSIIELLNSQNLTINELKYTSTFSLNNSSFSTGNLIYTSRESRKTLAVDIRSLTECILPSGSAIDLNVYQNGSLIHSIILTPDNFISGNNGYMFVKNSNIRNGDITLVTCDFLLAVGNGSSGNCSSYNFKIQVSSSAR